MNHIQTRESVRSAGGCYTDERIAELVPPEGNTPRQVASLPISDADRIWGLVYSCGATQRQLVDFSCRCARRVPQGPAGLRAIETAERWLRGEATAEECSAAADSADAAAADNASRYAAYAAASEAAAAAAAAAAAYADNAAADAAANAANAAANAANAAANAAYSANVAAYAAAYAANVANAAADAAERAWQIETLVSILDAG